MQWLGGKEGVLLWFFLILVAFDTLLLVLVVPKAEGVGVVFDFLHGELGQVVGDSPGLGVLHVSLSEDDVNLFQGSAGGLWVKEKHNGQVQEVHDGKEQVAPPLRCEDKYWGKHDNSKVCEPVAHG